jgi:hypothetical protein
MFSRRNPLFFLTSLVLAAFLTACGGGGSGSTPIPPPPPPTGQFTHVYVVFPPDSGVNNQHFMATVMNQKAIEGVTVPVAWRDVETGTPGLGTCNNPGTDTCQLDSAGLTHTYDWSAVDTANAQWFAVPGPKKVNIILNGIGGASPQCDLNNSCINPLTPYYVTTSSWAMQTASVLQDVINGVKDSCTNDVGLNTTSMTRDSSGVVTVTEANHGYQNGDTIWVTGAAPPDFNVTSQQGVLVQSVSGNTFQYQSGSATAGNATTLGTVISRQQSYPVPYEKPYKTGWKAFVGAAIYHFNHSPKFSQIDYMRVGRSLGGEAYPLCQPTMELLPAPNAYTKNLWLQYYTDIDDFVQSQGPNMLILDPLNEAGTGMPGDPKDPSYGTAEAAIAVAHKNANNVVNGFGSQGLQASDITNYPSCASDWCNQFNADFQSNDNLELQQLGLSAPVSFSGVGTGDLRPLLPFAVSHHMTILELYNLDALLAYDPNYCVLPLVSGACGSGSVQIPAITLPPAAQAAYFQAVGQPGQSGATGDGSYETVINQTQGQH